ncbi:MAG TPA: exodeoxyribonuclease III [Caulobacteraceae bacterium]|nr:exodeoxyribonuclease III [Caulobacteraceae bacterium]
MRVATFNINDIRKRFDNLLAWLAETEPDVVCLQELKAEQGLFPAQALAQLGYDAVWRAERTWNGVAILVRDAQPVQTRASLPGDVADAQARYIEAAVQGLLVCALYAPNGNPAPGPKFDYKLAWLERLIGHAQGLIEAGAPAILVGDFNVVPTAADIYPTRSYDADAVVAPEARACFQALLDQGWTDGLRTLKPDGPLWTYWSYKRARWEADKGIRLDHLLVSPALAQRLRAGGVDRWVRGEANASDHAPAWIELDWP